MRKTESEQVKFAGRPFHENLDTPYKGNMPLFGFGGSFRKPCYRIVIRQRKDGNTAFTSLFDKLGRAVLTVGCVGV